VAKKKSAAPVVGRMKERGRQIALLLVPEDERLLDEAVRGLGSKLGVTVNRTETLRWLIRNARGVLGQVSQ